MRRPRNPQNTIVLLVFIIIILALALALSVMANFSLLPGTAGDPVQAAPPGLAVDGDLIMARAADFGVSIEFLQLIFPGYLVYQDGGAYVYQPLDPELPLHDYLWRRLFQGEGRIYYQDERYPHIAYGIDVSTYQGEIDWQAVAGDGVDFAMIRLGYRGYSQGALF